MDIVMNHQAATAGSLSKALNPELLSCVIEINLSHSAYGCLPNAINETSKLVFHSSLILTKLSQNRMRQIQACNYGKNLEIWLLIFLVICFKKFTYIWNILTCWDITFAGDIFLLLNILHLLVIGWERCYRWTWAKRTIWITCKSIGLILGKLSKNFWC